MNAARLAIGAAIIAAWLIWWVPSFVLGWVTLAAAQARFLAEMAVADLLALLGCRWAARRLLARVILRNRRLLRASRRMTEGRRR